MVAVTFEAADARAALRNAIGQLEDMTPIYSSVGEYMVAATKDRFQRGVSPSGAAWAPKKKSTLDRYKRLGYGQPLKALWGPSGALRSTPFAQHSRNAVVIGSSLIYSGVMQEGAAKGAFGSDRRGRPIPWGRIPARAWLGISAGDERAIIETVEEKLAIAIGEKS